MKALEDLPTYLSALHTNYLTDMISSFAVQDNADKGSWETATKHLAAKRLQHRPVRLDEVQAAVKLC